MPRKRNPDLRQIALRVNEPDYLRLQELYATTGVALVIRALIRAHLIKVDRKFSESQHLLPAIEIDLGDLNV